MFEIYDHTYDIIIHDVLVTMMVVMMVKIMVMKIMVMMKMRENKSLSGWQVSILFSQLS